jgi:hypothetical protein
VSTTHVDRTAVPTVRRRSPSGPRPCCSSRSSSVSTTGLVLFTVVWGEGPVGAGAVFAAFVLATTASAVAALPGLLRGRLEAWAVVTVWSCCYTYWSVYKVFGEREYESAASRRRHRPRRPAHQPQRARPRRGLPMTARRALLALPVALAPLLQIAGMLPHPVLPDSRRRDAGPHRGRPRAVVAHPPAGRRRRVPVRARRRALAGWCGDRGAAMAAAGAVLLTVGCGALAVAFSAEAHLWSLAADPSLDRSALVPLVALEADSPAMSLLRAGFPLVGLGTSC